MTPRPVSPRSTPWRVVTRRTALRAALVGSAGLVAAACAEPDDTTPAASTTAAPGVPVPGRRVLVVFFSRAGENYYNGGRRNLEVGNTEVVAGMIRDRIGAELYKIEPAEPYPDGYDDAVRRNSAEQSAGARPVIAGALPDVAPYDVIVLGSPVWSNRAPRIMSTFIERVDLRSKTVLPLVTYAVSGMSGVDDFYEDALPSTTVAKGLAIRGEEAADSGNAIDAWLRENDLTR